ncbi:MAG: hypothetical protein AABX32_00970 [Nanoarchaeota archaeon]
MCWNIDKSGAAIKCEAYLMANQAFFGVPERKMQSKNKYKTERWQPNGVRDLSMKFFPLNL